MARIRTIKPDFWTDEKIVELPMEVRLFFIGSWNFADDNGNLQRSAKKLKMQIFPADAIDCEPLIQELLTHGLLTEYEVDGEKFLHIKGFKAHQVINRPSKTGLPTLEEQDLFESLSESSLTEGKGREGNREGKGNPPTPRQSSGSPAVVETGERAIEDRMTDAFLDRYKAGNAYSARQIRRVIADTLANGTNPDELWAALERIGVASKPVSAGTLQFAFAEIRKHHNPSNVIALASGQALSGTDATVAGWADLAASFDDEESA